MQAAMVKNVVFPLRQWATGRRDLMRALTESERTQWRSAAEIRELQLAKLRSLVEYAHQRVPYYRSALDEAGVGPGDIESLECVRQYKREPVLEETAITSGTT